MNRPYIFLLLTLLSAPFTCCAQTVSGITESIHDRVTCEQSEKPLVGYLVMQRSEGVPAKTLIEKSQNLPENDGSQFVNIGRIEDVYLDRAITLGTLVAYRSARCVENATLQNFKPFQEFTRNELLKCQSLGFPGDRKFGNCIYDVVAALKKKVSMR